MTKKYKKISVTAICLAEIHTDIEKLFIKILKDYCQRFKVKPLKRHYNVGICIIEYPTGHETQGMTAYADGDKILIQVRDPNLTNWEISEWVVTKFYEVLCHEIVHACQYITGRDTGLKYSDMKKPKGKKEKYFFDPVEVEARALEAFYTCSFVDME